MALTRWILYCAMLLTGSVCSVQAAARIQRPFGYPYQPGPAAPSPPSGPGGVLPFSTGDTITITWVVGKATCDVVESGPYMQPWDIEPADDHQRMVEGVMSAGTRLLQVMRNAVGDGSVAEGLERKHHRRHHTPPPPMSAPPYSLRCKESASSDAQPGSSGSVSSTSLPATAVSGGTGAGSGDEAQAPAALHRWAYPGGPAGPDAGGILVIGKDSSTQVLKDGGAVHLKSSKTGKFCRVTKYQGLGLAITCDAIHYSDKDSTFAIRLLSAYPSPAPPSYPGAPRTASMARALYAQVSALADSISQGWASIVGAVQHSLPAWTRSTVSAHAPAQSWGPPQPGSSGGAMLGYIEVLYGRQQYICAPDAYMRDHAIFCNIRPSKDLSKLPADALLRLEKASDSPWQSV